MLKITDKLIAETKPEQGVKPLNFRITHKIRCISKFFFLKYTLISNTTLICISQVTDT